TGTAVLESRIIEELGTDRQEVFGHAWPQTSRLGFGRAANSCCCRQDATLDRGQGPRVVL
ncbi:MAG TPA: hypothetical protein VIY86_00720, partial [Pirellulaceae bacterium]